MREDRGRVTFASLDRAAGLVCHAKLKRDCSHLELWYEEVRDTPIDELGMGDLCRACRQDVYLECVLPFALEALESNPMAGEMYDGELMSSLEHIRQSRWMEMPGEREACLRILMLIEPGTLDVDVGANFASLKQKLGGSQG